MKMKVIKKYSRELYEIIGIWEVVDEFGGWTDTIEVKPAKEVSGKRLRQLCRPEVIKYFNWHEGIKLHMDAKFNVRRMYKLYADHNYRCGSDDDVDVFVSRVNTN